MREKIVCFICLIFSFAICCFAQTGKADSRSVTSEHLGVETTLNNRVASRNTFGYIYLQSGLPLSTQIKDPNTIYEIRYNYDLAGKTLFLPNDTVLKFEGGSITNGTIEGSNIYIEAYSKCFDNVRFTNKTSFRNDRAHLSWWANDGDDCTSALEALQSMLIPTLYLDLYRIYVSHPIEISTRSRIIVGLEASPRSDWDLSGINKCTNILPTNNFVSNNGISSFFYITESQSEGLIKNICFTGKYKVKHAIFQNAGFFTGHIENNRFTGFTSAAIVLNCTTEDAYIENNYFTLNQCAAWISTTPLDENNLLHFDYSKSKGATNLVRFIENYITHCCYGLICQIGTDIQILRNCISHTSTYAIYARVYGVANLDGNYFEGCGRSSYWINEKGLSGDLNSDKTCTFLMNKHRGENNDIVSGWGLSEGSSRIRPMIYIFGEPTDSWDLKAVIRNSWISNNVIRSLSTNAKLSADNSIGGIDCFACVGSGDYLFENNSCPLWRGNLPKYYIGISRQGQSINKGNRYHCEIRMNDLPKAFKNKGWLFPESTTFAPGQVVINK